MLTKVSRLAEKIVTSQELNDRKTPSPSWAGEHCLSSTLEAIHGWLGRNGHETLRLLSGFKIHFAVGAPASSVATASALFDIGASLTKATVTWKIPDQDRNVARFVGLFINPLQLAARTVVPRAAQWIAAGRGSTSLALNSLEPAGWQRLMKTLLDHGRIAMAEYEQRLNEVGLYPVTNVHMVLQVPVADLTPVDFSLGVPEKRNTTHDVPIGIFGPDNIRVGVARVRVSSPPPIER